MPLQDCLEPQVFAEGEYILKEGAPLGSEAKFYLIESGTVTCLRTTQVQTAYQLHQQATRCNCTPVVWRPCPLPAHTS